MRIHRSIVRISLIVLSLAATGAFAHEFSAGKIEIEHPWAHLTAAGATEAPVYMYLRNRSKEADVLVSASCPDVAEKVELHDRVRGTFTYDVHPVEQINLPVGTTKLEPNGPHVRLIGLKRPLNKREEIPLVLQFRNAGKVNVHIMVEAAGADPFYVPMTPAGAKPKQN